MISLRQIGLSVGSALAAAAVSIGLVGPMLGTVVVVVVGLHEVGHYVMARLVGAEPHLPILLPLGIVLLGWTTVEQLRVSERNTVARAGPITGLIAAGTITVAAVAIEAPGLAAVGVGLGLLQLYSATLGADHPREIPS